jgi:uncharacterized protein YbjT (DUF2867 family)
MIAVMGAAGNVGGKVADLLVRQGQPVRALEHRRRLDELGRRGAEVVAGDLADAGDLGVLLKDVEAALVVLPDVVTDPEFAATRSRMSRVIADALRASRVEHVVALSTVAAGPAPPGRRPGCASSSSAWPSSGTAMSWCSAPPSTWRTCWPACP